MAHHRRERVEEAIHEALAEVFLFSFKDPRMPAVFSVTAVKVTADLQLARVYFTQRPDDKEAIRQTLGVLERAAGFLRSEVADAVSLRHTPKLEFFFDEAGRRGERIEKLLRQARAEAPPEGESGGPGPPAGEDAD